MDRRVKRTRALLGEAMLALIQERPYEAITIQEITDRADLNRATFYLHFGSKEELLAMSLEDLFDELVQKIQQQSAGQPHWQSHLSMQVIYEHVAERADLYKALLGHQGLGYVMHRILAYIARYDEVMLRQELGDQELSLPIPIMARHVAGSLFALVSWWVEQDMPYTPEEMALMSQQLCLTGTQPVLDAIPEANAGSL